MKKTIFLIATLFLTLFFSVGETIEVSAKITNPAIGELGGDTDQSYQDASSGQTLLAQFVRLWANAMTIGALLVIVYFLWGALEWILSGGDTGKLDKARQRMMHAALGMIILVSSYVILGFISSLLFGENFDLLNLEFITPGS
ncbi:MAG TPA: hypothetical protein PKX78_01090 [Candidatus Woesebacteria bacterium]|nr:hypothetical protein [Candidatus Woesebacteria bacterium]